MAYMASSNPRILGPYTGLLDHEPVTLKMKMNQVSTFIISSLFRLGGHCLAHKEEKQKLKKEKQMNDPKRF